MARVVALTDFQLQAGTVNTFALKSLLFLILVSFSQPASASERDLSIDIAAGPILAIEGEGRTVWIGTAVGLFRWDKAPEGKPARVPVHTDKVHALLKDGNTLWVGSEQGLYRWDDPGGGGLPQLTPGSPKSIEKLDKFGTSILMVADGGMFVLMKGAGDEVTHLKQAGLRVRALYPDGVHGLWIGSEKGLFRWDGAGKRPESVPAVEGVEVTSLYKEGSTLLIGTTGGLLRWIGAPAGRPEQPPMLSGARVYSLYKDISTLLISVRGGGLFRLDNVHEGQPVVLDESVVNNFHYEGGSKANLWMGGGVVAEAGLYRWDRRPEERPRRVDAVNTGYVHAFHKTGDTLLIGGDKGLFRLDGQDQPWNAKIRIIDKPSGTVYSNQPLLIKWKVENSDWHIAPEWAEYTVVVENPDRREAEPAGGKVSGRQEFTQPPLPEGTYSLYVKATDLNGKTDVSPREEVVVHSSLKDAILGWVKDSLIAYAALNILTFIILLFLSRWYKKPFDLLMSPWVRKPGLYFGFVLCHVPAARRWVFERYYQRLRKDFGEDRPYVPAEVRGPDGAPVEATSLLGRLSSTPDILVQGGAGSGKTELLKRILRDYCESPNLRGAYKRYRVIPIMIPLREYGDPREPASDATIPELARLALDEKGMWFSDGKFFERLLRAKDFLVLLDGLNEVSIDRQVNRFIAASPGRKLLATSQTALSGSGIRVYHLPQITTEFAKRLLAAFIGEERAARVCQETPERLWEDIKTGYDVRLIQNLVEAGRALPTDRLELYDASLDYASDLYKEEYPLHTLYRHAWGMWKEKKRRFEPNDSLTDTLIEPLVEAKIVVARGRQFEFRHDLMHSYLAACWLARGADSIEIAQEWLSEEGVWDHSRSEQTLVFLFLAELIHTPEELQPIAQFAADGMPLRTRLLLACQETAKKRGWLINVSLYEPSPDLSKA